MTAIVFIFTFADLPDGHEGTRPSWFPYTHDPSIRWKRGVSLQHSTNWLHESEWSRRLVSVQETSRRNKTVDVHRIAPYFDVTLYLGVSVPCLRKGGRILDRLRQVQQIIYGAIGWTNYLWGIKIWRIWKWSRLWCRTRIRRLENLGLFTIEHFLSVVLQPG